MVFKNYIIIRNYGVHKKKQLYVNFSNQLKLSLQNINKSSCFLRVSNLINYSQLWKQD